jgi:hypothetical protein
MSLEPLSNILKQLITMLHLLKEFNITINYYFYFKNLILPLITRVGENEGVETSLNSTSKAE